MIAIGSDHGGVELKDYLVGVPCAMGVEVRDCGTQGKASVDPSIRSPALAGGIHKISQVERDLGTQITGQKKK